MKKKPLIAAIDVGTNSFHIIIASVNTRSVFTIHSRDKESVRLGEGSGDMKYISPEAMARGVLALKRFTIMAHDAKATIRAIGTSAIREALNREEFLRQVYNETGIDIEVISGTEEARLIYLGVLQSLAVYDTKTLIVDIGGGSTETAIGLQGELRIPHSAKLGAIRLTKKFFPQEKITDQSIHQCRNFISGEWALTFRSLAREGFQIVVGSSGTIQTLVTMALALKGLPLPDTLNGTVVSRKDILSTIDTILCTRTYKERSSLPGMDPKRADIIVAGSLILEQLLLNLDIEQLTFSAYALREGILLDTVHKQRNIQKYHHLSNLRYESVLQLCDQCQVNMQHSEHVKNLALEIFDAMHSLHQLGDTERELLEAAAYLHDTGYHISADQHHKHSYYIIKNATMLGFTNDETELIANIARYHRKSHPKFKHENFQRIPSQKRSLVSFLSGILRIAEGLDRRQQHIVQSVEVAITPSAIMLSVLFNGEGPKPDIEIWGAERKKLLLEELTGKKISFIMKQL